MVVYLVLFFFGMGTYPSLFVILIYLLDEGLLPVILTSLLGLLSSFYGVAAEPSGIHSLIGMLGYYVASIVATMYY